MCGGAYEDVPRIDAVTVWRHHIFPFARHKLFYLRADMESAPTISNIIQTFKRYSIIEYIKLVEQDPTCWEKDRFYCKEELL